MNSEKTKIGWDCKMNTVWGQRIRERRRALNVGRIEMAEYLGVTKNAISKYETGDIPNIPLSTLIKICEFLGTTPNDILL